MKACLQQQPMFCSREESTYYLMLEQNEKSTQNPRHAQWPVTPANLLNLKAQKGIHICGHWPFNPLHSYIITI